MSFQKKISSAHSRPFSKTGKPRMAAQGTPSPSCRARTERSIHERRAHLQNEIDRFEHLSCYHKKASIKKQRAVRHAIIAEDKAKQKKILTGTVLRLLMLVNNVLNFSRSLQAKSLPASNKLLTNQTTKKPA